MKSLEYNIKREQEKLDYYGKAVASLLLKKDYSNFLKIYMRQLYDSLMKYDALTQARMEYETLYAPENSEEDKEDEEE